MERVMSAGDSYVVQLFPHATDPLKVMRLSDMADLPVAGPALAAAADAILADHLGRQPTWREVQALTAIAFDELGERHAFSIRVPQRQVLSAVDAAAKEAAAC